MASNARLVVTRTIVMIGDPEWIDQVLKKSYLQPGQERQHGLFNFMQEKERKIETVATEAIHDK